MSTIYSKILILYPNVSKFINFMDLFQVTADGFSIGMYPMLCQNMSEWSDCNSTNCRYIYFVP